MICFCQHTFTPPKYAFTFIANNQRTGPVHCGVSCVWCNLCCSKKIFWSPKPLLDTTDRLWPSRYDTRMSRSMRFHRWEQKFWRTKPTEFHLAGGVADIIWTGQLASSAAGVREIVTLFRMATYSFDMHKHSSLHDWPMMIIKLTMFLGYNSTRCHESVSRYSRGTMKWSIKWGGRIG